MDDEINLCKWERETNCILSADRYMKLSLIIGEYFQLFSYDNKDNNCKTVVEYNEPGLLKTSYDSLQWYIQKICGVINSIGENKWFKDGNSMDDLLRFFTNDVRASVKLLNADFKVWKNINERVIDDPLSLSTYKIKVNGDVVPENLMVMYISEVLLASTLTYSTFSMGIKNPHTGAGDNINGDIFDAIKDSMKSCIYNSFTELVEDVEWNSHDIKNAEQDNKCSPLYYFSHYYSEIIKKKIKNAFIMNKDTINFKSIYDDIIGSCVNNIGIGRIKLNKYGNAVMNNSGISLNCNMTERFVNILFNYVCGHLADILYAYRVV